MADDLYLLRKNAGQWIKYTAVIDLTLTGATQYYSGVTGNHSTGVITIPGSALIVNETVVFTSLTGGLGILLNMPYYVITAAGGSTCQLSTEPGGTAIAFTTDITAATLSLRSSELQIWSPTYRDIFPASMQLQSTLSAQSAALAVPPIEVATLVGGGYYFNPAGFTSSNSDDVGHNPLRQTLLNYTAWRFDRGSGMAPRYLYAMWQDGDIIADNPPQTA
jgi:hypothetical protein